MLHHDVDDRRAGRRRRDSSAFSASGVCGSAGFGLVAELVVGIPGELEVPAGAVDFARLLEPLADRLLAVELARLDLEHRPQIVALDDGVAVEGEVADLVAVAFGDGNPEIDEAGLLVLRVADDFSSGCPTRAVT